jgi:hypothetical protein
MLLELSGECENQERSADSDRQADEQNRGGALFGQGRLGAVCPAIITRRRLSPANFRHGSPGWLKSRAAGHMMK